MWLPGAQRITGNSAGSMNRDGSRKLLLHSTEGSSIEGAVGAYRTHNSWPHLTVDCVRRRIVQHLPLDVAARSLRNDPGGADETNRDGTILVQVELVGFAERPASIGDVDDLDWFGADVVAPICALTGVPLVSSVTWAPYPASYGEGARQRLSVLAWDRYDGVLGHQHAPDNDHGDPGSLDVDRILTAARGDDDMTPAQQEWLDRELAVIRSKVETTYNQVNQRTGLILNALKGIDVDVDEDALAAAIAPLVTGSVLVLTDADLAAIATAVNDEQHRRSAG